MNYDDSGNGPSMDAKLQGLPDSPDGNEWVHLALLSNSESVVFYMDGVVAGETVWDTAFEETYGRCRMYLGGRGWGTNSVPASMADIRYYTGDINGPAVVATVYDATLPLVLNAIAPASAQAGQGAMFVQEAAVGTDHTVIPQLTWDFRDGSV